MCFIKFSVLLTIVLFSIIPPNLFTDINSPHSEDQANSTEIASSQFINELKTISMPDLRQIIFEIEKMYHGGSTKETSKSLIENERSCLFNFIQSKFDEEASQNMMMEFINTTWAQFKEEHKYNQVGVGEKIYSRLKEFSKKNLERAANALRYYHNKVNGMSEELNREDQNSRVQKGLELNEQELISYIIDEINEHPEIADIKKLKQLMKEYSHKFKSKQSRNFLEKEKFFMLDSSIENYFKNVTRYELFQVAFAVEFYHKSQLGIEVGNFFGGLHDYITSMDDSQIKEYIVKEIQEHPEMNSLSGLQSLLILETSNPRLAPQVDSTILKLTRDELIPLALELEKYHKEFKGQSGSIGGLHDYIYGMKNKDIVQYIVREIEEHSELNDPQKIKQLISKCERPVLPSNRMNFN